MIPISFSERSTKTRSGAKSSDYREVNPKVFEEGGEKCPVLKSAENWRFTSSMYVQSFNDEERKLFSYRLHNI
jgi:hypothetical protein